MNKIVIEESEIGDYIIDNICSFSSKSTIDNRDFYHHSSSYEAASSICDNGLLSLNELNDRNIVNYSENFLKSMSDTDSHINGVDGISLCLLGLTDLYEDEPVFDPTNPKHVDFLLSKNIKAGRNSLHYGNEYIAEHSIGNDKIRYIDIRILKCINLYLNNDCKFLRLSKEELICMYNYLRKIANSIKLNNLDVLLRERSYSDNICLDLDKIIKSPELVLKKIINLIINNFFYFLHNNTGGNLNE